MNTELLIKLVKLANHNPNDNEANLAARKVCKMIEEARFNFSGAQKPVMPGSVMPNPVYQQQQAQQQKQQRQPPKYSDYRDIFSGIYESVIWDDIPQPNKQYYPPDNFDKKSNLPRDLKCKTCGKIKSTKFVGLAELFECQECQWIAYERNKK